MKTPARHHWPATVLLIILVAYVGYSSSAHRSAAIAAPSAVVTLDLERVFNGVTERRAADERMVALAGQLDAEGQRQRDEIDLLAQDVELFPVGSKEHHAKSQELARKGYELQAYRDFAVRKLEVEKSRSLRRMYRNIKRAVAELAEIHGYDLVLVDDSVVELPMDTTEAETWRQISARRTLFSNPKTDITDEVTRRLNETFNGP